MNYKSNKQFIRDTYGIAGKTYKQICEELNLQNLIKANLSQAYLVRADLRGANLSEANLSGASLKEADLSGANLSGANLSVTNLSGADLSGANLSGANLNGTDLDGADLSIANFIWANLRGANLRGANLREADLNGADLNLTNLNGANLSGAKGLLRQSEFLKHFEKTEFGIIVYKAIGNTIYPSPKHWKIEAGAWLEENCNPCRTTLCGCGVNVATLKWCKTNHPKSTIWKVLIHWKDVSDIVVPYNTDGKFRAACVQLLSEIEI